VNPITKKYLPLDKGKRGVPVNGEKETLTYLRSRSNKMVGWSRDYFLSGGPGDLLGEGGGGETLCQIGEHRLLHRDDVYNESGLNQLNRRPPYFGGKV